MASELTLATDRWIEGMWGAASDGVEARLVALGGYGRRELSLASDVDLVLEVDEADVGRESLVASVERFMAWCREPRVKVAHAVRTRQQTWPAFEEDFRTAVAYLDARPIVYEEGPWALDAARFLRADDDGVGFVRNLFEGYRQRHNRYGQTIYRLEPEVKNGPGGLRDLHAIRWAARVRFDSDVSYMDALGFGDEQREVYERAQEWILRLRLFLHASHGRKHDRLNFADQEALARLEIAADSPLAVMHAHTETLMREHYRVAKENTRLAERMLRLWGALAIPERREHVGVFWVGGDLIGSDEPLTGEDVLAALAYTATRPNLYLEPSLETRMEEAIGQMVVADASLSPKLRELLVASDTIPATTSRILDMGLLVRLIPEFEPLVCHVHHDVYHVYTTDVHSIQCLEAGRALVANTPASLSNRWPYLRELAQKLDDPEVFLFACLVHDIGKNRGGDHSRKGAAMMATIGPRMGFRPAQTEAIAFLVREHLSMARIARRRDLGDIRVIRDLATMVRTTETLRALTLLTFCDMATVGEDVLSDWTASLIFSLYQRVKAALDHGVESLWQQAEGVVAQRKAYLATCCQDDATGSLQSALDGFLRDVPVGHILDTPEEALARQFEVYRRVGRSDTPVVEIAADDPLGTTEVIVAARDVPGALASITGTLSACGLTILSAQIVSTGSKRTLDIFRVARAGVQSGRQQALVEPRRVAQVKERLERVLKGEVAVEELLAQRLSERRLADRPMPAVETLVQSIPGASDTFTVIEIRAQDRPGLLYEIASTLQREQVNIHLSKVDSVGLQVIDTFYVERHSGGALDDEHLERVLERLREVLSRPRP